MNQNRPPIPLVLGAPSANPRGDLRLFPFPSLSFAAYDPAMTNSVCPVKCRQTS